MQAGPQLNLAGLTGLEGLLPDVLSPLYLFIIVLGSLMMIVAVASRNWQKAMLAVFMLVWALSMPQLLSDLGMPGPVIDPLAGLGRHFYSIVLGVFGLLGGAGGFLLGRTLYRRRRRRRELAQARQDESSLRYEYSEWLKEEALKLEIDALSAPGDQTLSTLLERVQEARNNNMRYFKAEHEEPVLRDAIQKEWHELRGELNRHRHGWFASNAHK